MSDPEQDTKPAESADVNNVEVDLNDSPKADDSSKALNDDLFFSTISDPIQNEESDEKKKQKEDMDDIFRDNAPPSSKIQEIKLTDDEEDDPFDPKSESKPVVKAAPVVPASININPAASLLANSMENNSEYSIDKFKHTSFEEVMMEDEEDRDKFLEISLSDPTKVGDGMGSYMVYKLTTKTNYPAFKSREFQTSRRFSDFLSLYEKLKEKHLAAGRIMPPAPEKDMIGMAKVKMSKEDTAPIDFIGKRRAALERFLNRLGKHKAFRFDPDFRDFIEISEDLPKATNTSALSGAGMVKMFKSFTDGVSKITVKMEETDQWFEDKTRQIDNLHQQFTKLHSTIEILYGWRRDLSMSTKELSKSTAILANSEEQLNLSRALSQLGEIYEKIDVIYSEQANSDYFVFGELVKDYVGMFDSIKEVFHHRTKVYSNWKKAEDTLRMRKETKTKLETANKQDKIPAAAAEIRDWEMKVEKYEKEFDQVSKTIKEEVKRFDFDRIKEFKIKMTKYLETLLTSQEQLVTIWEQYLPQVKAI